ncbi:DUF4388 domain-containing protein [Deinococcus sp.]|uniref:DUF4388 domain-containing protein n=1 Tax=Deinococcus sp. TaxID=47478 RepID=UPI003CC60776
MLRVDLAEFAFPAVLQMLLQGGVSGHARISGVRQADVWLRAGQVVQASMLGRGGNDALELLGIVEGGELQFETGAEAPAPSPSAGRDALLRQLMVDASAWEPLLELFPDWSLWPRFTLRWSQQQPVTHRQYRALLWVGRASLEDIIRQSDLGPRELLTLLAAFRQAGLIELVTSPGARVEPLT